MPISSEKYRLDQAHQRVRKSLEALTVVVVSMEGAQPPHCFAPEYLSRLRRIQDHLTAVIRHDEAMRRYNTEYDRRLEEGGLEDVEAFWPGPWPEIGAPKP